MTLIPEAEAAAMLGLCKRTLQTIRGQGMIQYVRSGRKKVFYTPADLDRYIAENRRRETPPCPSVNPPKARAGSSSSSGKANGIMARRAARQNATQNGMKLIIGGKSR